MMDRPLNRQNLRNTKTWWSISNHIWLAWLPRINTLHLAVRLLVASFLRFQFPNCQPNLLLDRVEAIPATNHNAVGPGTNFKLEKRLRFLKEKGLFNTSKHTNFASNDSCSPVPAWKSHLLQLPRRKQNKRRCARCGFSFQSRVTRQRFVKGTDLVNLCTVKTQMGLVASFGILLLNMSCPKEKLCVVMFTYQMAWSLVLTHTPGLHDPWPSPCPELSNQMQKHRRCILARQTGRSLGHCPGITHHIRSSEGRAEAKHSPHAMLTMPNSVNLSCI